MLRLSEERDILLNKKFKKVKKGRDAGKDKGKRKEGREGETHHTNDQSG